ncbi:MAG TPA: glucokinase [Thermoanaerobaculia bacterium]|nr:glucokinase [Thermoanaerobaculia bacterium]
MNRLGGLVVAGDVGGTKTNLGLFRVEAGRPLLVRSAHFVSAEFPGLAPMLEGFLAGDRPALGAACFGVPGPVVDNRSRTPNLAWQLDGSALGRELRIPAVLLVNDLVATAHGIPLLAPEDLAVLQVGQPGARGNRVLIAAGTGLGMALMPEVGEAHVPVPSEGGHMDFAPRGEGEVALFRTLRARFGHVSVERVVSGPGLHAVYEHLRDSGREAESEDLRRRLLAEDPSKVIAEAAIAGASRLCDKAMETFAAAYGAAAGNLALLGTATGGVFLGGGIAPKILPKLQEGTFVRAFADKGRFQAYLEAVPVRVILNDRTAMFGAAGAAVRLLAA